MTKKVAVILSGCGYLDGAEIHESILTLLALDKAGAVVQCFAPNIDQAHVVNHMTGKAVTQTRNVLVESARIARGDVKDLAIAKANEFDALIFPGGFGAALNLSDFASKGVQSVIHSEVLHFAQEMKKANKPIGFICIAPALIPHIYDGNVHLTIGQDKDTAAALNAMGCHHIEASVDDIVIDEKHKVVSTPAYMLGPSIAHVEKGITKLVKQVLGMC